MYKLSVEVMCLARKVRFIFLTAVGGEENNSRERVVTARATDRLEASACCLRRERENKLIVFELSVIELRKKIKGK